MAGMWLLSYSAGCGSNTLETTTTLAYSQQQQHKGDVKKVVVLGDTYHKWGSPIFVFSSIRARSLQKRVKTQ